MMSLRPLASVVRPLHTHLQRGFHVSLLRRVQIGDSIPAAPVLLMEGSPGNKVDLSKEVGTGRAVIVGVPAAFSTYLLSVQEISSMSCC